MDRDELAGFLRQRRGVLQPSDVGLPAGRRRRTPGLRQHEVAELAGMSSGYYVRLEQGRRARPSVRMLNALARALRLTRHERDRLFRAAGRPASADSHEHVRPGVLQVVDALDAMPAQIISDLDVVLVQNRLATALLGDQTCFTGLARSSAYRWFTDPASRAALLAVDHYAQSRTHVSRLRAALQRRPGDGDAQRLVRALKAASEEFSALWTEPGDTATMERMRVVHPTVGLVDLDCDIVTVAGGGQQLLILTARPGSPAAGQLQLLRVIGHQRF
jgi:transcriptional regulator with XRE-family HTH domain